MIRATLVSLAAAACIASPAFAGDRELLAALDAGLGPTASASRSAASGTPSLVQRHYDRARDLQESVRRAAPFSASCHSLGGWAARYANGSPAGKLAVTGGLARGRLVGEAGRYNLEVRFARAGSAVGVARSAGAWLLPGTAGDTVRPPKQGGSRPPVTRPR